MAHKIVPGMEKREELKNNFVTCEMTEQKSELEVKKTTICKVILEGGKEYVEENKRIREDIRETLNLMEMEKRILEEINDSMKVYIRLRKEVDKLDSIDEPQ